MRTTHLKPSIAIALRAQAQAKRAQASALTAEADALDAQANAIEHPSDLEDLIDLVEAAVIAGCTSRVLLDESRRDRITLLGRRGHWRVSRAELTRWMHRRPISRAANDGTHNDPRADARASIATAAARASRGGSR